MRAKLPRPRLTTLAPACIAAFLVGCAGPATIGQGRPAVDNVALGADAAGDPCTLQFRWHDPAASSGVDRSYSIFCGGSAGRVVGAVTVKLDAALGDGEVCGEPRAIALPEVGPAEARRCSVPALGVPGVAISFRRGGLTYRGVAQPQVAAPLQNAMVAVARHGDMAAPMPAALAFDANQLAALPANAPMGVAGADITNPDGLLRSGIRRNQLGLYVEASRELNNALGRLPTDVSPALRAELELEAALADSNISAFDASKAHFAAAQALLAQRAIQGTDRYGGLAQKLRVYTALDQLNQRDPRAALATLDSAPPTDNRALLNSIGIQRDINALQVRQSDTSSALANENGARDLQALDVLADRTRSVALLGMNRIPEAQAANASAQARLATLSGPTARGNLSWLTASVARQDGRIAARRRDWPAAETASLAAIASLEQASTGSGGLGQAVAETRIEHAGYMREAGKPIGEVTAEYERAVNALVASGVPGVSSLPGIDRYLDLLVEQFAAGATDAPERFFRVAQVLGKPAIARQTADIQSIVAEDPAVGAKVRRRLVAVNDVRRLTNLITDAEGGAPVPGGATLDQLRTERRAAETMVDTLNGDLAASNRFRTVDDSPVSLGELRDKLLPGEVFFKLTSLPRGGTYGIVIGRDRSIIYKSIAPTTALMALSRNVRATIDNDAPYDVTRAYTLFKLVAGDAAAMLTAPVTRSIVIDPAGPLETLPLAVLVTDEASVKWYAAHRKADAADFSQVSFVAAKAEISTALWPRSFLLTRSFAPITSGRPFIGFGRHQVPTEAVESARLTTVQERCPAAATMYRRIWNLTPISDRELGNAARALGDPDAPSITGAAFTDTAVVGDATLSDYRVIHFATHGLPEKDLGCGDIPPALVTSLGSGDSDGLLSFDEVARLRLHANLVVLSACDTASGISERTGRQAGIEGSATLAGLVRSFLAAEARAVLATYWQIPATEQSEQLLATFYASGRTHSIGTALRDAQLSLIHSPRYSHPYNWGAFFLVGDASKSMLGNAVVARGDLPPERLASR